MVENRQGNAVFITKLDTADDETSRASSAFQSAPEETFEELEDRIESVLYESRKGIRDGQRDLSLIESEMQSLQFKVFNENQLTYSQILEDIQSLSTSLQKTIAQERGENAFFENQLGKIAQENSHDGVVIRQLAAREENLNRAVGSNDDFQEIIPGFLEKHKAEQSKRPGEKPHL